MKTRIWAMLMVTITSVLVFAARERFVSFPGSGADLLSPDGRYIIRNENRDSSPRAFTGAFHTLFLDETARKSRRKLCDYIRHVQVAWTADSSRILVNDYYTSNSSRALVFSVEQSAESTIIDKNWLITALPAPQAERLRNNKHVYIQASGMNGDRLLFNVRGYGEGDPAGFRLNCEYAAVTHHAGCETVR